jgi:transcriptional regulator with XRE-family HTH domain
VDDQLRSLALNLRRCRTEARFTQGALARAVGVGQTAISQWEQGVVIPTVPNLLRVMQALGCEPVEPAGVGVST